jgi:metal-responsive CopG/Arc/MetJ family transcriptional regulator
MAKIAISVPDEIFEAIEIERKVVGESRSAFVCRAVKDYLDARIERQKIEQYVKGYRENPETPVEIASAQASIDVGFSESPWDSDLGQ